MAILPETRGVTVEVDLEIESIVPEFLEKRSRDCLQIFRLLETGAYIEIKALGHRMKGAGGSYGFDDISELGEIIEEAAQGGDKQAIIKAVQKLLDYLKQVRVVYV